MIRHLHRSAEVRLATTLPDAILDGEGQRTLTVSARLWTIPTRTLSGSPAWTSSAPRSSVTWQFAGAADRARAPMSRAMVLHSQRADELRLTCSRVAALQFATERISVEDK
jgi:hypothetical protein